MKLNDIENSTLIRVWKAVFQREPKIEIYDDEILIDGDICLSVSEEPGKTWMVSECVYIYNYPHSPDDVDFVNESHHVNWYDVISDLVASNRQCRNPFVREGKAAGFR